MRLLCSQHVGSFSTGRHEGGLHVVLTRSRLAEQIVSESFLSVLVSAGVPHWIRDVMPLFCTDAGIVAIPALPEYGTSMVVARDAMIIPNGLTEHGSTSWLAVNWPGQPYSD